MKKLYILLFLAFINQLTADSYNVPGFTYAGELDGHFYFISDSPERPEDILLFTLFENSYLAAINSEEEDNYILSIDNDKHLYIGLVPNSTSWTNGEPLNYNNFCDGEPGGVEPLVIKWKDGCDEDGQWGDHTLDWHFMIEFVDKEGTVFHKGVEQPKLKGTLKPTKVKPPKKRVKINKDSKMFANAKAHNEKQKLKRAFNKQKDFLNGKVKL